MSNSPVKDTLYARVYEKRLDEALRSEQDLVVISDVDADVVKIAKEMSVSELIEWLGGQSGETSDIRRANDNCTG